MDEKRSRANLISIFFATIFLLFCPFKVKFSGQVFAKKNNVADGVNFISSVHFLDVGQGDCTFMVLPDGKKVLIDGGSYEYGSLVCNYLKSKGVSKIDILVATHADSDHVGGLCDVLSCFEVETIFRPFVLAKNDEILTEGDDLASLMLTEEDAYIETSDIYANFIKSAYEETCDGELSTIQTLSDNIKVFASAEPLYMLEVLSPFSTGEDFTTASGRTSGYKITYTEEDDNNSISAVINYTITASDKTSNFLLMSDATDLTENRLIERAIGNETLKGRIDATRVLRVAHHGSQQSTSEAFLNLVNPQSAIISVGTNGYGHPNNSTLERLNNHIKNENIYRTDISGNIVVEVGDNGLVYAAIVTPKVDEPLPSWVMFLSFGLIIVGIIALSVLHIVRRKLKKDVDSEQDGQNEEQQPPQGPTGNNEPDDHILVIGGYKK